MHIEHFVFLSWFSASPESHEQDGEKLSRATATRENNSVWRSCHGVSNLALSQERSLSALAKLPAASIAAGLIERSRHRDALRNTPGSNAPRGTNHRRMPSFSIKFL
jgi:hypothetical protein